MKTLKTLKIVAAARIVAAGLRARLAGGNRECARGMAFLVAWELDLI